MKYIAYGSNMVTTQMAYRCPESHVVGTGYIENARLEFFVHATVVRCGADEPCPTRVPVVVWDISENDLLRLDRYEGFPNYYTKDTWSVTMSDGSQIEGLIYLMSMHRAVLEPPADSYFDGIEKAYREFGFSSEIESILKPALMRSLFRYAIDDWDVPTYVSEIEGLFYVIGLKHNEIVSVSPDTLQNALVVDPLTAPAEDLHNGYTIQQFGFPFTSMDEAVAYAQTCGTYKGINPVVLDDDVDQDD